MDFKQIQELIKLINKSNIGELSIEEKDFKITIKQKKEGSQSVATSPVAQLPAIQSVTKPDSYKNGNSESTKEDDNFLTIPQTICLRN